MKKFTMMLVIVVFATACGGEYEREEKNNQPAGNGLTCGFGTHQQGAECVADANKVTPETGFTVDVSADAEDHLTCGQGTHEEKGVCITNGCIINDGDIDFCKGQRWGGVCDLFPRREIGCEQLEDGSWQGWCRFIPEAGIPYGNEICDGLDNDCDGEVDEGCQASGLGLTCGKGTKQVENECLPLMEGVPCDGDNDPGNGTPCVTTLCKDPTSNDNCEIVPGTLVCGLGYYLCSPATSTYVQEPKMCEAVCMRRPENQAVNLVPPLAQAETTIWLYKYTCESSASPAILQIGGRMFIGAGTLPHDNFELLGRVRLNGLQGEEIKLGAIQENRYYFIMQGKGRYRKDTEPDYLNPEYEIMYSGPVESGDFTLQKAPFAAPWQAKNINYSTFGFSLELYILEEIHDEQGNWQSAKRISAVELLQLGVKTITLEFTNVVLYSEGTEMKTNFVLNCDPLVMEMK